MKAIPQTSYGETNQAVAGDITTICCGETLQGDPKPAAEQGARMFCDAMGTLGEAVGETMIRAGDFGDAPFATTITLTWDLSARQAQQSPLAEVFQRLRAAGKYTPQF